MSFTNADLLAIKAELTNDPQTLGLDANPAHDEVNANKLNAVRTGDPGFVKSLIVTRRFLATQAIFGEANALEVQALTSNQHSWWSDLLQLDHIDPFVDAESVSGLRGLFGEETASRTNLEAAFIQDGSRIEQLFQAGTLSVNQHVTPSDISNARAAT